MAQSQNKRAIGTRYEELAANYLTRQGVCIIAKNFRTRNGEIDLVARDKSYLVFIEVKFRKGTTAGSGAEAVNLRKQKTICRISDFYRARFGYRESTPVRFDVVECAADTSGEANLTWFRNAFPYHPAGRMRALI